MSAVLTLCATGVTMGIVHVLTGPDHLSAIATLSVNVGNFRAFWFGVRWGIGHSIGLIVVASVFIAMENLNLHNGVQDISDNSIRVIEVPERIQNLAECFVGIFMLALGSFNLYLARRTRGQKKVRGRCHHHHCHRLHDENDEERVGLLSGDSPTEKSKSIGDYGIRSGNSDDAMDASPMIDPMGIDKDGINDSDEVASKKFLSLCIGIFHGVAGPGGVLGVVPAVKLHNVWHSVAYLGTFCASSIVTMGCFAATYGSLSATWSKKNDGLAYRLEIFSASLSILVGCTWLILLYLGILDDVFP
mmetsp:Transcript_5177/g.12356  ORF Transcript_5177/g.12356 Transcript_5177/m.12356 type:complete len:303 (+) Transcript_5177:186-1094(+)